MAELPRDAIGLKLHRIKGDKLISCEAVFFTAGWDGVDTVLRRARLAGRVDVGGDIQDHFADVLIDSDGSWSETVALDAGSYGALKNHWMRCKIDAALASGKAP